MEVPTDYWSIPADQLCKRLETTIQGLTDETVQNRLTQFADARMVSRRRSWTRILLEQFESPIIWLLSVSAILSFYVDYPNPTSGSIILFILIASGCLGFWQEWSADDAVAKLLERIETLTNLRRDGQQVAVPTDTVVPGDVVVLNAGALIPADCRIIESKDLFVDEAALTGESYPIEKTPDSVEPSTPVRSRTNCLFLGTHVVSGMATAVAVKVGRLTEFGGISARLEEHAPETGFEKGLKNFGKLLIFVAITFVTTVFILKLILPHPEGGEPETVVERLSFALALAVGMTPQLLPAITSVVLAAGAKSMARKQVIVKKLIAIENFGGMNILCSDKTGTLTEGKVELHSTLDLSGSDNEEILRKAYINATMQSGFENPIDHAIREHRQFDVSGVRKVSEIPYDFFRRRLSVLVEECGQRTIVTKGALANILDVCKTAMNSDGQTVDLESQKEVIDRQFMDLSNQGFRVLGVAQRELNAEHITKADESDMTFIGCLVLYDPPKPGVLEMVQELEKLGVGLKIITGDNRTVTGAISRQVGLTSTRVMTGGEIKSLSDDELIKQVADIDLFAEVEPNQKERIIISLKRGGNIVGYMGDGINDASALHAADVGISVATAVDVAKEAAQIVLLKHDLGVLVHGVEEGRATLANTLKYVFVSISGNFGYMFSMAVFWLFIPYEPLLPTQVLLINLLADFPAMALATDSVDPELIERPRRWEMKNILLFMLCFGLSASSFDFVTFGVLLKGYHADMVEFRTGWFVESVLTGLVMMILVRTQRPFYQSQPGRWLTIAALVTGSIAVWLPYSQFSESLNFMQPPLSLMALVFLISIGFGVAMETVKYFFYQRWKVQQSSVLSVSHAETNME